MEDGNIYNLIKTSVNDDGKPIATIVSFETYSDAKKSMANEIEEVLDIFPNTKKELIENGMYICDNHNDVHTFYGKNGKFLVEFSLVCNMVLTRKMLES